MFVSNFGTKPGVMPITVSAAAANDAPIPIERAGRHVAIERSIPAKPPRVPNCAPGRTRGRGESARIAGSTSHAARNAPTSPAQPRLAKSLSIRTPLRSIAPNPKIEVRQTAVRGPARWRAARTDACFDETPVAAIVSWYDRKWIAYSTPSPARRDASTAVKGVSEWINSVDTPKATVTPVPAVSMMVIGASQRRNATARKR